MRSATALGPAAPAAGAASRQPADAPAATARLTRPDLPSTDRADPIAVRAMAARVACV
jgi:hypothetical protein